jgi:uncharacterized LabA/DUF88 family protein
MHFHATERVALFIDGANLYATSKALEFEIDFKRLISFFQRTSRLVRANYYSAVPNETEHAPVRPLIDWLEYNGFTLITKPAKEFTDANGRRKYKGNMDVELAVDAMQMAKAVDHLVIFSGDGDFCALVRALQDIGKRTSVVSTMMTQPPMIADELRRQADCFIELATMGQDWGRLVEPKDLNSGAEKRRAVGKIGARQSRLSS